MGTRRLCAGAAVLLAIATACTGDEDVTDDPVVPDNVDSTVTACAVEGGAPFAEVEVTNGTSDPTEYEVTVRFLERDTEVATETATTPTIRPGTSETVRVEAGGSFPEVTDCDVESVDPVDG